MWKNWAKIFLNEEKSKETMEMWLKLSKIRKYKKYLGKYKIKVFKEFRFQSEEKQTDINTVIEESNEF